MMGQIYTLPFDWEHRSQGAHDLTWKETAASDQRWLESIKHNAAPFTDWWTQARIIQLAYLPKAAADPQCYQGLASESDILTALRQELRAYCRDFHQTNPAQAEVFYPGFEQQVDLKFIKRTLTSWKSRRFAAAVSRNFEVYQDVRHANVFLVVSTAAVSLHIPRSLPPLERFRPLFNVKELAAVIQSRRIQHLTLRTHGYANPAQSFFANFCREAEQVTRLGQRYQGMDMPSLSADHLYIGYHWPSEKPLFSPGLWTDFVKELGIVVKFLFVLSGLAGIVGTVLYALLKLLLWLASQIVSMDTSLYLQALSAIAVRWYWVVPTVFMIWVMVFHLLRLVVYQRDRYRAVHYGAPDLAEFFWRLDKACNQPQSPGQTQLSPELREQTLSVNLIGHSMGGLVLVNVLRILSDRFGKDDRGILLPDAVPVPVAEDGDVETALMSTEPMRSRLFSSDNIGEHLQLDQLILASPDIPLEFLREGRNNYVRSAMKRCQQIYLLSSDRDIVLRYLSAVGNWFTEPSLEMSGLRLGNLYLKQVTMDGGAPQYRPFIRNLTGAEPAVQPTSSYDLFRKFNYLDCSEMGAIEGQGGVNAIGLSLGRWTALPIDLGNTLFYFLGKIDVHGGYFHTETVAFQIMQLLVCNQSLADADVKDAIGQLIDGTKIRFLPSQPWMMPVMPQQRVNPKVEETASAADSNNTDPQTAEASTQVADG